MPHTKPSTQTPERLAGHAIFCLAVLWILAGIPITALAWLSPSFGSDLERAGWTMAGLAGGPILLIARGIWKRRIWARNAGIALALGTLVAFPIGTIFGIFLLLQLVIRWHPDEHEAELEPHP